jgi:GH24 family phage-related lysozyme (muramidase)
MAKPPRVFYRGVAAAAALLVATVAVAEEASPANTLVDLRRQFEGCLSRTPLPTGSRVTIVFMTKRDGSIFGKPRITYSHLEGDAEARKRFLDDAERAVDSCLPLKVTPALGAAIAGRMFSITLGREKPQTGA